MALKFVPLPAPLDLTQPDIKTFTADETSSYPCRRCLTNAVSGEEVFLLSYNPFLGSSHYTGPGPVFVHAESCSVKDGKDTFHDDGVPRQQRRGMRSVRAYDEKHMMIEGRVVEGEKLKETAEEMLRDRNVEYLHVHYAGAGCFAVRVERDCSREGFLLNCRPGR